MHGLAPRVVLGSVWWDKVRQLAYASTDYHCIACGVFKTDARFHPWLEGHEVYAIDYRKGRMTYVETVPLCHCCHNYIHRGRLEMLLEQRQITQQRFCTIVQHGDRVLSEVGLVKPLPYEGPMAAWSKWHLVVARSKRARPKEYKPLFKSFEEYVAHWSGVNDD